MMNLPRIAAAAVLIGATTIFTMAGEPSLRTNIQSRKPTEPTSSQSHQYVGMWITKDGHIRHELLPNGRYDEARGNTESAYQGRYEVTGDHIEYWDDTGFSADGEFRKDILYHAGMILYRDNQK